ncbi:MAG: LamG-like jellyroll fold domain-containing protein, partial [Bacteroidota bacterium]
MKKIISTTSALVITCITLAQVPTFKWVDGSQEVRGEATLIKTTPGPRQGASSYVDDEGNFWLFGGFGHDFTGQTGYLNDVWKYDRNSDTWIWMEGQMATERDVPSYNNSLQFDGIDDRIDLPQNPVAYDSSFTVELWFKTTTDGALISYSPMDMTSSNTGWGIEIVSSGTVLWIRKGFSILQQINGLNLTDDNWHHIAMVFTESSGAFSNQSLTIYLDGDEVSFSELNFTFDQNASGDHTTIIGAYQGDNDQIYFTGEIDEVRFWNEAKNGGEIKSNYTYQLSGNEEGLSGYYDFNQGIANGGNNMEGSLLDVTENGNHGPLGNIYREGIYFGKMAEVRMWTSVLSQSDIYDIANRPVVGGEINLLAFYDFTDGVPEADNTAVST